MAPRNSRNFQGNDKKPVIGRKVPRGTYERVALMHSMDSPFEDMRRKPVQL